MADTGTSLNMLPEQDYQAIFNHFFVGKMSCERLLNTLHSCHCSANEYAALPDLTFDIGGETYTIFRHDWVERSDDGQCVIKFMHAPGSSQWILGLNFFKNYYTVFDYSGPRIGFADSINRGKPSANHEFIDWATGKTFGAASDLSNLSVSTPTQLDQPSDSAVCVCALLFTAIVFGIYYSFCHTKRNE